MTYPQIHFLGVFATGAAVCEWPLKNDLAKMWLRVQHCLM